MRSRFASFNAALMGITCGKSIYAEFIAEEHASESLDIYSMSFGAPDSRSVRSRFASFNAALMGVTCGRFIQAEFIAEEHASERRCICFMTFGDNGQQVHALPLRQLHRAALMGITCSEDSLHSIE